MTYFPSYDGIVSMSQLQLSRWDLFEPYMEFIHRLMTYPAGPSQEEKEVIAAFCSLLNACDFCYGAHRNVCVALGIDETHTFRPRRRKAEARPEIRPQTDARARPHDGRGREGVLPGRLERRGPDHRDHRLCELELVQPHDPRSRHR